jgi:hypothetical protein
MFLPDSSTPEAMQEVQSGKNLEGPARDQAGQKGFTLDEVSGTLSQAGRDFMVGSRELYMRLYDCPPSYEWQTRGQGHIKINTPCLTMFAASTPVILAPHLKANRNRAGALIVTVDSCGVKPLVRDVNGLPIRGGRGRYGGIHQREA